MEFLSALGGVWAVIWTLMVFAVVVGAVEFESMAVAFVVTAIGLVVLEVAGATHIRGWIQESPMRLILLAVLYLACGALWSVVKWWFYVRKQRPEIKASYENWKDRYGGGGDTSLDAFLVSESNPVKASKNKHRIMVWMVWWVPSLFWTVCSDIIMKIWDRLYDMLVGIYTNIANRIAKSAVGE